MRFASCSCIVCDRINLHSNLRPPHPLPSPSSSSVSSRRLFFVCTFLSYFIRFRLLFSTALIPFSLYIYIYLFLLYAASSLLFAPRAFGHPRTLPPISGGSLLNPARIVFKLVRAFAFFLHLRIALFPVVLSVTSCRLLKGPLTDSCYLIFLLGLLVKVFCIYFV